MGVDGNGYCEAGHTGPRCELCTSAEHYFDYEEGYCMDCPVVAVRVGYLIGVLSGMLLLFAGCARLFRYPPRRLRRLVVLSPHVAPTAEPGIDAQGARTVSLIHAPCILIHLCPLVRSSS